MTAADNYPIVTTEQYIEGIGKTHLVKLDQISKEIGRNVYFKAEYENSGTSIKDRAANYLLKDALESGKLTPGGTLAEATAGNTGLSLALLGRTYDPPFKVVLFVPENLVQEKIDLLESLGATVVKGPLVAPDHPEYVNNLAIKYAKETPNTIHVNQMDNLANRRAHYETTGPEIWEQTNGKVDGFVAGAGTGATFGGVVSFLKTKNPNLKAFVADREGSGLYSYVTSKGESWAAEGDSLIEGVGKLALTGQLHDLLDLADGAYRQIDRDVVLQIYELFDQGLDIGASGGLNILSAVQLAKSLPEGSTVVTTVADHAHRYASKLLNKEYLESNGIWEYIPEHLRKYATFTQV
ncbi:hypothetical protein WICMUC_001953 [Wickerhamomyces mucosus]|uniref:Tryptophan synthase beta chain-like PALP domain-containing protein n=1 Tax=Wickerhamomyces mucosus TaxID=1378264 RepID=A0A9P8PS08_9ASCO|nr:hypothetical protein WICMUC_001953 [Wickerhamomyces mucosus]